MKVASETTTGRPNTRQVAKVPKVPRDRSSKRRSVAPSIPPETLSTRLIAGEAPRGFEGMPVEQRAVVGAALAILRARLGAVGDHPVYDGPAVVRAFLELHLADLPHEVFAVMFLDSQHRLIAFEELFRGTLGQASVYPREIVKRALAHNAAAAILAHNHPSGVAEPSAADIALTGALKSALGMVDVRVLDHFVVGSYVASFVERGLL